jgi:hypothetical protein
MNRIGLHVKQTVIDEACASLGLGDTYRELSNPDAVEPLPTTQEEIDQQAFNFLIDLFPKIPNTDCQIIINKAFKQVCYWGKQQKYLSICVLYH